MTQYIERIKSERVTDILKEGKAFLFNGKNIEALPAQEGVPPDPPVSGRRHLPVDNTFAGAVVGVDTGKVVDDHHAASGLQCST